LNTESRRIKWAATSFYESDGQNYAHTHTHTHTHKYKYINSAIEGDAYNHRYHCLHLEGDRETKHAIPGYSIIKSFYMSLTLVEV